MFNLNLIVRKQPQDTLEDKWAGLLKNVNIIKHTNDKGEGNFF